MNYVKIYGIIFIKYILSYRQFALVNIKAAETTELIAMETAEVIEDETFEKTAEVVTGGATNTTQSSDTYEGILL